MAKSPKQRRSPPPVSGQVRLLGSRRFFDPMDVNSLSEDMGITLAKGADPVVLAESWSEAFHLAAFHGLRVEGYPASPSALREYHAGVLAAAQELWERLGIPGDLPVLGQMMAKEARGEGPWFLELIDRVRLGVDETFGGAAASIASRLLNEPNAIKLPVGTVDPGAAHRQAERDRVWRAVEVAPYAIALVAMLARDHLEALRDVPPAPGRRENRFKKELYKRLAGEFQRAFGFHPETGRERDQPNCASSIWIEKLTLLAAERIPERILLSMPDSDDRAAHVRRHPLVLAVQEIAEQSFVTKADALATGWKELIEKSGNSSEDE